MSIRRRSSKVINITNHREHSTNCDQNIFYFGNKKYYKNHTPTMPFFGTLNSKFMQKKRQKYKKRQQCKKKQDNFFKLQN